MQKRLRHHRHEAEQYRVAADDLLGQLDWVIEYLNKIKKRQIAAAIRRNRDEIARRLA